VVCIAAVTVVSRALQHVKILGDNLTKFDSPDDIDTYIESLEARHLWQEKAASYGKLVVLNDPHKTQKPIALCLPPSSSIPWIRLFMRLSDKSMWDDPRDSFVQDIGMRQLEIVNESDVTEFLAEKTGFFRGAVVRDPAVRVLQTYVDLCKGQGLWANCMTTKERPLSFPEFIGRLDPVDIRSMPAPLKLQLDMCNIRGQNFDLIGRYEHIKFFSEAFLKQADRYDDLGVRGWGAPGDASFSDLFLGDGVEDMMCEMYTPQMLDVVIQIYEDDYRGLNYSRATWQHRCHDAWQLRETGESFNAHMLPEPGQYQTPVYSIESTCSADASELRGLAHVRAVDGVQELEASQAPLKFFLHEMGPFNFTSVLDCFLSSHNISMDKDDWDDHVLANVSEHLGEAWLLKALKTHGQRTFNQENADLHIIGALPFISYQAAGNGQCGGLDGHQRRMLQVSRAMTMLEAFKQSDGRDFFVFTTHYRIPEVYSDAMLEVLHKGNVIVGTADLDYTHWKPYPKIQRMVVMPYKAHYLVENAAFDEKTARSDRDIDFLFRGKIVRANEGSSRQSIRGLVDTNTRKVDIEDIHFFYKPPSFSDELAVQYIHSRFCYAPAGDSPTSRRLFDALGGGCIPLALGNIGHLSRNLPFKRTIDWSKVVVFAGSLDCIEGDKNSTRRWLGTLSGYEQAETQSSMRKAGLEVFRGALSYTNNGKGLATALLTELQHHLYDKEQNEDQFLDTEAVGMPWTL